MQNKKTKKSKKILSLQKQVAHLTKQVEDLMHGKRKVRYTVRLSECLKPITNSTEIVHFIKDYETEEFLSIADKLELAN